MTILLEPLIQEIRDALSDSPFDLSDDKLLLNALKDSYDYIRMVVDEDLQPEMFVRRCLIRLATYEAYRNYTGLASVQDNTVPETAGLQLSSLLMKAYACLTMIAKVPINEDLSLKDTNYPTPVGSGLTNSSVMSV